MWVLPKPLCPLFPDRYFPFAFCSVADKKNLFFVDDVEVAALRVTMKHTMINTATILSASLCLSCIQPVAAAEDLDGLLDGLLEDGSHEYGKALNLIATARNGRGTITYNGKTVWKGRVKSDTLTAIGGRRASGENPKYAEGTDLSAVWDGDKLLWENVEGAGLELEPERQKLLEMSKRLDQASEKQER